MAKNNSAHSKVFGGSTPTPPKVPIAKVNKKPSDQKQPERKAQNIDLTNRYESLFNSWGGLM